jgi:MYXO-CTERM domain-containing protein
MSSSRSGNNNALGALAVGFAIGLAVVSGCSGLEGDDISDDGAHRGELLVYQADDFDTGTSRTTYALKDALGVERPLRFDADPKLRPGTLLKVWGDDLADGMRVTSFKEVFDSAGGVSSRASALIGAPAFPARTFAFVLVDIGGGFSQVRWDGSMHDVTTDFLMGRLTNDDDSLKNYYLGTSYGMQDIGAKVVGPLQWTPDGCDTSAMASALRPMVDAQGGPFQHYLYYYGTKNADCSWSGLASVGTPQSPQRNTWYNQSVGCVVLIQEPGHNFGMQHSSSLDCGSAAIADDPNDCDASEYGDGFDPMGGGCRHMNVWQKTFQGWLSGCNGVRVQSSGTFNVLPLEPACNGVQFLQIKAPKARPFMRPAAGGGGATTENLDYYYVEVRTPVHFDGALGGSSLTPRVLVHMAADTRDRDDRGLHTFLLDMTPSTNSFSDAALPVGMPFTDPAGGLTITVNSVGNAGASITVEYANGGGAAPTCLDGTAFTAPGPGMESCDATIMPTGVAGAGGGTGGRGGGGGNAGSGGRGGGAAGMAGSSSAGEAGQGGSPLGTAGSSGGTGPGQTDDRIVTGGCSCEVSGSPASGGAALMILIGLVGISRRRRS